ncbi:MAG: hypothetical protein GX817_02375 [Elusimicrobia bacterium]|nr:hypothetical protein [Elusimicrobiota bacterium]
MEKNVKKMLFDNVENPWEFVVNAVERYKKEFLKTSKIGRAPSIDTVLEAYITELMEEESASEEDLDATEEESLNSEAETAVTDA